MNLTSLQSVADLILSSGCKPNARYRRALRALTKLEQLNNQPYVPPQGTDYNVVLVNGREVKLFVPKGMNVFQVAQKNGYQVQSVMKA
jgi:hypothetical protein